ncbi:YidC/Oxa1 family membrane protein insertase [Eggerthellaceae bacterium zg-1084]|uniref:Membrane protein insertase YidC n=1 Tax=Berryella wangjianweii TaxID=2734634 RepID=A0A6M8IXQ1_9ACTN|nr:YidC/Oxa1 family membrane protein insertase [Berryella wangjianweii]NPD30935.1 YidC/Oxa1 family membrane protein insertase [Berryella wangjianweii]NPD31800.1 YidC/Oxa1 family membrane protein insertase [Eggerthellaceae bacterium zg-997]QKF07605.1 YidC/Oxa1 family membrane protein insertase [Berryella wangjianweii]
MWDAFKNFMFDILTFFHGYLGDWGLAILAITVLLRLILSPLTHASTRSTYQMQKIQPKLKVIQERYADDKQRLTEEMQKLYAEAKFNPLTGCLPMFLQMPIFIALFQVLNELTDRIGHSSIVFLNIVPDLVKRPSDMFAEGLIPFIPYLILLLVFSIATFAPMVLMTLSQKDNPQRNQTLMISGFMTIFMLWIGWGSPAGVLLYWGMSSLIGVAQQQISLAFMKARDKQAELTAAEEPAVIEVIRKEKKKRPTKKR